MGMRARLQGVVFWLMVSGVLVSALVLGANRPPAWLALSAGALGLFAVQMLLDLGDARAGRLWARLWPVALLWLGVVAWAAVQALPAPVPGWAHPAWAEAARAGIGGVGSVSADPGATWHGVLRYLGYGAIFWIAARAVSAAPARALGLVDAIALFAAALGVYGLAAWAVDWNPIAGDESYPGMVKASFVNRNAYALHAGLGAMACLTALILRLPVRRPERLEMLLGPGLWYLAGLVVLVTALVLTGSRAGVAVGLAGMIVVLWQGLWHTEDARRGPGLVFLALLLAVGAVGTGAMAQRLGLHVLLEDQRFLAWAGVWQGISERPWTGHGLGAFHDAFRAYMPSGLGGAEWNFAHNSYLEHAFELGGPGALALVLALALVGASVLRGLARRRGMRPVLVFALAALTAGALHALVDFSLQMPANAALLALILGPAWALSRRDGEA